MQPTIGRIVHYTLSEHDADAIEARRGGARGVNNRAEAGQTYPAIVVRTFGGDANLQVMLDGPDTYWATSRGEGEPEQQGR
ncbi:hypothetical protein [Micromonospora aurantiaca (nom. illeg.)]|uniref:hypothetical protein n=1 Tax=Micromonospora aurantiaca (nom. illeg.) TaxID=47850 RepID=UPI0033DCB3B6